MSPKKPLIALVPQLAPDVVEIGRSLQPAEFEMKIVDLKQPAAKVAAEIAEADFVLGFPWPLGTEVLDAAKNVRLLQLMSAGYDEVNVELAREHGIPVALNGGANSTAVAEHTIMFILATYKHLVRFVNEVRSGVWKRSQLQAERLYELEGKIVGLVGIGNIGRKVAARVKPFGASVQYYDVFRLSPEQESELGVRYVDLDELLATSDVVSLHIPLLPETQKLIGAPQLALMKHTAILVNTARGGLIDEEALAQALREKRILAAALDTLSQEPPPPDHPLIALENCIITPHNAGPTWDSWPKRFRNGFDNIVRVARGEPPHWVIPEMRDVKPLRFDRPLLG